MRLTARVAEWESTVPRLVEIRRHHWWRWRTMCGHAKNCARNTYEVTFDDRVVGEVVFDRDSREVTLRMRWPFNDRALGDREALAAVAAAIL
jgi:hypothetical protein